MAIEEIDRALELWHIDCVAISITSVEPSHLILAITELGLGVEQIVGECPLIIQEVLVVWRMLNLSVRLHGSIAHELVLEHLDLVHELD